MADRGKPSRSRDVLDAWVEATAPQALAYARSLVKDASIAEDLLHDCYCRLLKKADVYDLPRDGAKLLHAAVTNACINWTTRHRRLVSLDAEPDEQPSVADWREPEPPRKLLDAELEAMVAEALARLSPLQRAALELKSLGHSLKEIAAALSVSTSSAGVLIHRARLAMTEHLAPYLEEEAG